MMSYNDLVNNVDIQVQVHLCYYDYDKDERIFGTEEELGNKEIKYMYTENDEIIIEVDMED
jgi:hypothetical protein